MIGYIFSFFSFAKSVVQKVKIEGEELERFGREGCDLVWERCEEIPLEDQSARRLFVSIYLFFLNAHQRWS